MSFRGSGGDSIAVGGIKLKGNVAGEFERFSTKKNSCSVSGGDIKTIFLGFLGGASYLQKCYAPVMSTICSAKSRIFSTKMNWSMWKPV